MVLETQMRATLWRTEDHEGSFPQQGASASTQSLSFSAGAQEGSHPLNHSDWQVFNLCTQIGKQHFQGMDI